MPEEGDKKRLLRWANKNSSPEFETARKTSIPQPVGDPPDEEDVPISSGLNDG